VACVWCVCSHHPFVFVFDRFRGLKAWLPLKLHGVDAFADALAEKVELAGAAAEGISGMKWDDDDDSLPSGLRFEVAEPDISLFPFYLTWDGSTQEEEDRVSREVLEGVNLRGRVMLTGVNLER
jgi:aromatic-L-amino-acid/L-tryptophan decarboxylase